MTTKELDIYNSMGITDNIDVFGKILDEYGARINDALVVSTDNAVVAAIASLEDLKLSITDSTELDTINKSIEAGWNSLSKSFDKTWKVLLEEYDQIVERTKTVRETFADLASGDGIDYDQWTNFLLTLDSINTEGLDYSQVLQYSDAINGLAGSLEVVNGMLYVEGENLQTIGNLEEQLANIQIEATKQELINKKTELEANKAVIDAQIAQMEYTIAAAENSADANALKEKSDAAWIEASNQMNQIFVQNNAKLTEAMVTQYGNAFLTIGDKFNALMTGMSEGKLDSKAIKKLESSYKAAIKDSQGLSFESYAVELSKYSTDQLKNNLAAAKNASANYALQRKRVGKGKGVG